jgi:hypothetical protein
VADGSFIGEDFLKWLKTSTARCIESGHHKIALQHIGEILFYCPSE